MRWPGRDPIQARGWPAFTTSMDGRVITANDAARQAAAGHKTARTVLGALSHLNETDIYRLARSAVRDGLAAERLAPAETGTPRMLTITPAGPNRLVWQVMPTDRLVASARRGTIQGWELAPFGYLRIGPDDDIHTNATFRHAFAASAAGTLREQVDAGIFVAGRTLLPGAGGHVRLALTAIESRHDAAGDTHEIFLFIPDTETASQVSAAETLDAIPVSLVQLDLEGRILWGNTQARRMLGANFTPGTILSELIQPLGRSLDSLLNEARAGNGGPSGDMARLLDGDDDTFVRLSLTRMTLQNQPCLIAVVNDASELRRLEDKFAQSQKMEAVGKLAGGVAHDFNNVLTAISGHCDLLLLRKDASDPDFPDLMQIRQNVNRAATLVRQLLAFSRKQTLQPKFLDLHDVVTESLYLLDRLIGANILLDLEHGHDLGSVRADQQQLEQALMNLVVNARDAMPEGGTVTITTRNVTIAVEQKRPGVSIPIGEYIEIGVADQGAGIAPKVIDRIFDPFFTTKPKGEGTGLGLSTVYGIVKQSGGYIYAENLPEAGARFTMLLPRAWPGQAEKTAPPEPRPAMSTPDLTGQGVVLLVEDEAPVRSFAARALRLRGYSILEAESAEEAMILLSEDSEQIDVLVSDVVMPGMDGPTLAARARTLRPDLRIILISGYAEDSLRHGIVGQDFQFLPKPFSLGELTARVKAAMEAPPGAPAMGVGTTAPPQRATA